ncbi:MAG: Protein of unknown function transrane [Firmicutes bacterium]|nr:Protein of unknown function transrane [Bacillota bacterium]
MEELYLLMTGLSNSVINGKIILLSIIFEALPFLVLSVFVSATLNNFVTERTIRNILPRHKFFNILPAALLGLLLPVCDCGMVIIVRRLVQKGVPLYTALAFMLAAPIVNPVAAAATAFAFKGSSIIVGLRLGTALVVAYTTAWLVSLVFKGSELKAAGASTVPAKCCGHEHLAGSNTTLSFSAKLALTLRDAGTEFIEMGKYLLLGSILSALAQILLDREILTVLGQHRFWSIGIMMLFGFCLSVCSSADAFIAASFITSFSPGSLIAFMVFGPMLDLKNFLMLAHAFRERLVVFLTVVLIILCFGSALVINLFWGG